MKCWRSCRPMPGASSTSDARKACWARSCWNGAPARCLASNTTRQVGARARTRLTEVYCGDVETMDLPFAPGSLDCIICADVLEHLRNPYDVLKRFAGLLSESGTIVSSIPNVRHYSILHMLAEGCGPISHRA